MQAKVMVISMTLTHQPIYGTKNINLSQTVGGYYLRSRYQHVRPKEGGGVNDGWERNFGYHEYVDNVSSMNIRWGGDPIVIYAFHVSAELCEREYRARGQAGGWWRQELKRRVRTWQKMKVTDGHQNKYG